MSKSMDCYLGKHECCFNDMVTGCFGYEVDSSWDSSKTGGTLFGLNTGCGVLEICSEGNSFAVAPMMYFAVAGRPAVVSGTFWYVYVENFYGMNLVGGPLELFGRLNFIDGCTDSLLLPPVLKGDPCLNSLYFPAGIQQTFHVSNSCIISFVVAGHGIYDDGVLPVDLFPGMFFLIRKDSLHRFITHKSSLNIVSFYPEGDFGPEHNCHPVINKTIINGQSARYFDKIKTST